MQRSDVRARNVFVYIWFDIEDYVTPESDDLPLKAFSILEKHGVPVTCKLVAEKVRALKEHGRTDVISAIARQDVGYHLDKHSRHPTVYEYFRDADLLAGAEEFYRQETDGLELVERTFSTKASCFGHPGTAWSPHYYPAMRKMGIPLYLDETAILNLGGAPYWYCGVLNLNGANQNFIFFDYTFGDPSGIEMVKRKFSDIHSRLRGKGGTVSVMFHLHTAINTKFWDEVNFGDGRNTEKGDYKRPPVQPTEVTERAWRDFDEFVGHMGSFDDVSFITAKDAVTMYPRPMMAVTTDRVGELLGRISPGVTHVPYGDDYLSASEVLYFVASSLAAYHRTGGLPRSVTLKEPYGPMESKSSTMSGTISTKDLLEASERVLAEMEARQVIPSAIALRDGVSLSPADFLLTGGELLREIISGTGAPDRTQAVEGRLAESDRVDAEAFAKACKWVVLPTGFEAPKILEQVRLQTWTLRPAVLRNPPSPRPMSSQLPRILEPHEPKRLQSPETKN